LADDDEVDDAAGGTPNRVGEWAEIQKMLWKELFVTLPWSKLVFEFLVKCHGLQFDRGLSA
jgi:hypothetical protein